MGTFQRGKHASSFILLILTEGPSYGLEMLSKLEDLIPGNAMDRAVLYKNLSRLEKEECVTISLDDSEKGPVKKYYTLTEKGYASLKECAENIQFRVNNLNIFLNKYNSLDHREFNK